MIRRFLLLSMLLLTAWGINKAKAQYTMLTNFAGDGSFTGANPQNDQNLLSDGTYLYGMTYYGGANGYGTVFKIKIIDNTYTKLMDFAGASNGAYPLSSLIKDGAYLYGTTSQGGTNDYGTAFKIKISDNTYTKIIDFAGVSNGREPYGSLISDGTYLYGMTKDGGANDKGTAFKIKISDNSYTKIIDFEGTSNGSYPMGTFITDGTYLYGMTYTGGENGDGTAFKIKISDNSYTKIIDFEGGSHSARPMGSLISDGNYLYGMTQRSGISDNGTVFKIKISDNTYTKIMDFDGVSNGREPYGSLISDGTYLYGMTKGGGANELGTAFKIKISDNIYTRIYDFVGASNGSLPMGSPVSDGIYLYGITYNGGTNNKGTVYKLKISDNSFTKIMDFEGASNGSYPLGKLISDGTYLYGMTVGGGTNNKGTAFKIKISDNAYTKIIDFEGVSNGSSPYGSFISDGTYLYGVTAVGGLYGYGTAFKVKISDDSYTKIYDFAGALNGSAPLGSLVSDGTYLYGVTQIGGANNVGIAFKIKISDNSFTKIMDFEGGSNGSGPSSSLISDGTYLYGMTDYGGTNNIGTAFKIKISDNSFTKIMDFEGASNGFYPNGSFISDGTYLYGMTLYGGTNDCGTVFKIKISDNTYIKILDFSGTANGKYPEYSQLLISDNYLFGSTTSGGTSNAGTIFKYQIYYPEIIVKQNTTTILDNTGTYDFGVVNAGTSQTATFTIENNGNGVLSLTDLVKVDVTGTGFTLTTDAPATIAAGGSGTFQVTFTPENSGSFSGTVSIANDADENPYNFSISGTGNGGAGISELKNEFTISPNPSNGVFTLKFDNGLSEQVQSIKIVDITGTVVKIQFIGNLNNTIDLSGFANGIYFVQINFGDKFYNAKIMKQ